MPVSPLRYRLMYRLGFTPWDNNRVPEQLAALVEGDRALPPGRALDVGCGTGTQAVYLAQHGWEVTGVDAVERALEAARERARGAGVQVRWVTGDVSRLEPLGLEPGFSLLHDRGCFHDLPDRARGGYGRGVTALASPGAQFVLMAFPPGRRLVGPRGASEEEIRMSFGAGWDVVSAERDMGPGPPGPMRNVPRIWYRLVRGSS